MTTIAQVQLQRSLDDAQLNRRFARNWMLTDFVNDEMFRLATERLLERLCDRIRATIGPLPGLAREFPDIVQMVGLRNRLAHDYDNLLIQILWDVVQSEIPILEMTLKSLLELDASELTRRYGE